MPSLSVRQTLTKTQLPWQNNGFKRLGCDGLTAATNAAAIHKQGWKTSEASDVWPH